MGGLVVSITLPESNSLLLKMDGWNTTFLLGRPIPVLEWGNSPKRPFH